MLGSVETACTLSNFGRGMSKLPQRLFGPRAARTYASRSARAASSSSVEPLRRRGLVQLDANAQTTAAEGLSKSKLGLQERAVNTLGPSRSRSEFRFAPSLRDRADRGFVGASRGRRNDFGSPLRSNNAELALRNAQLRTTNKSLRKQIGSLQHRLQITKSLVTNSQSSQRLNDEVKRLRARRALSLQSEMRLRGEVHELKSRIHVQQGRFELLQDRINSLVLENERDKEIHLEKMSSFRTKRSALERRLTDMSEAASNFAKQIQELDQGVRTRFGTITSSLLNCAESIASLQLARKQSTLAMCAQHRVEMDSASARIKDAEARLDTSESANSRLKESLADAVSQNIHLRNKLTQLLSTQSSEVESMRERAAEAALNKLQPRIVALEERIRVKDETICALNQRVKDILAKHKKDIERVRGAASMSLNSTKAAVSRLSQRLKELKTHMSGQARARSDPPCSPDRGNGE